MLDHVYVKNFGSVFNVTFSVPVFGDHVLVLIELNAMSNVDNEKVQKRDWSNYNPAGMNTLLLNNLNVNNFDWLIERKGTSPSCIKHTSYY